jgi:hypothetical protein
MAGSGPPRGFYVHPAAGKELDSRTKMIEVMQAVPSRTRASGAPGP